MSTLAQITAVCTSAYRDQRNRTEPWLWWLTWWVLLGFLLVALVAEFYFLHNEGSLKRWMLMGGTVAVFIAAISLLVWMMIVANALRQCTSSVAAVMPRLRWAITLALTAIAALITAYISLLASFTPFNLALVFIGTGLFLMWTAALIRYPTLWLLWLFMAGGVILLSRSEYAAYGQALRPIFMSIHGAVWVALMAVSWTLFINALLSKNGLRKFVGNPVAMSFLKSYANDQQMWRKPNQQYRLIERNRLVNRLSNAWLSYATAHQRPKAHRLLPALGQCFNPVLNIVLYAVEIAFIALLLVLINYFFGIRQFSFDSVGVMLASMSLVINTAPALWHTRKEQALMMLVPGVSSGVALNRDLLKIIIYKHLATLSIMLIAVALVLALVGYTVAETMTFILLMLCVMAVILAYKALNNYARYSGPSMMLSTLEGASFIALWIVADRFNKYEVWTYLGVVSLVIAIPLFLWRRKVMLSTAVAWPTGRDASA
jgi:hypothetical protein